MHNNCELSIYTTYYKLIIKHFSKLHFVDVKKSYNLTNQQAMK